MNISLNEWLVNSYHFIKNNIQRLSPLQKRIAVFTTAFFSCIALGNLISRYYRFRANKKIILTIPERLEKNRNFALKQQNQEVKNFNIRKEVDFKYNITTSQSNINNRHIGEACCQGWRNTMEDATLVSSLSFLVQDNSYQAQADVFAVFDGHGGAEVATFVQKNFISYFREEIEKFNQNALTDEGIWNALKACFKKLNADITNSQAGTTATVAIILEDKIWVANVGDSRTILVKDGKATQASEDAKPDPGSRYSEKIIKNGEKNSLQYAGCWRVKWLAMARAIGDKDLLGRKGLPLICPNPKITCYSLSDFQSGYLVLACDGLYDVATTNEIGQAIEEMAQQKLSTQEMARCLVGGALANGSSDNVSVIVVHL